MGDEHPDWLPEGWEVCVKVRSYGRKDKYYINTSNGLKFNSKPEVLRYLKISGKSKEQNKVDITRTAAENLPPGWIKEIRAKKKGRKIRKDPVYIDPVSGCHFRSVPEVLRYLQTKDSGKVEAKPEDKDHNSADLKNHSQSSSTEPKRQSSIIKRADRKPTKKQNEKSDDNQMEQREEGDDSLPVKLSDEPQPGSSAEQHADRMRDNKEVTTRRLRSGTKVAVLRKVNVPKANHVQNHDCNYDSTAADPPNKLPKPNKKEQQEGGKNQNTRLADCKSNVTGNEPLKSGSKVAAVENAVVPKASGSEQREEGNNSVSESQQHENVKRLKKRKKPTSDSPRRTSRRLVREEDEPSSGLSNEAGGSAPKDNSHSKLSVDPEIKAAGELRKCNESNENPPERRTENPTSNKQKEPATLLPEDISRAEEHKEVEIKEEEKHEKQLDSSLEDLLMDPCIEFAIKTLTGAIPFEDVSRIGDGPVSSLTAPNQPSSSSPVLSSDDIWADPCFEFAVKTLTGEMPVENGSNLQLPLSPSEASGSKRLSLPTFGLENLQPLASFGHFGAETKDYTRQQNVKDLPLPHSLKDNAQNFVDSTPHNGVEGRRNYV